MKRFLGAILAFTMTGSLVGPASAMDFTVPADVKPILELTKGNWIGVREWDGQDLLYFTHLQVYRCAMDQIRYFVNVGKPRVREMEPCYDDLPTPYIMKAPEGHLPYDRHELNSIQTITVEITLKDGTVLRETFERAQVMIP